MPSNKKTDYEWLADAVVASLFALSDELDESKNVHRNNLQLMNKVERQKAKAVKLNQDDLALVFTKELVTMRKNYAYESGWIDGLKRALKVINDHLIEDEK